MIKELCGKKRRGDALPIAAAITIGFCLTLLLIVMYWQEVVHSADEVKDSITVSAQAVCLHDPVASSAFFGREDILFYTGSKQFSMRYYIEPEYITKLAAENTLQLFRSLLSTNLSDSYQNCTIKNFEIKNVIGNEIYVYDAITGANHAYVAPGEMSSLKIEAVVIRDSKFGVLEIPFKETVFLKKK